MMERDSISDIRPRKNIRCQTPENIRYHAFAKIKYFVIKKSDIRYQLSDITPPKNQISDIKCIFIVSEKALKMQAIQCR